MDPYKSKGERIIVAFLQNRGFKFIYEHPFLIKDEFGKKRIWYPDFYLPDLSIIIEFFGMENDPNYDISVEKIREAYKKSKIDLIELNPKILKGDWRNYVTIAITSILMKRLDK